MLYISLVLVLWSAKSAYLEQYVYTIAIVVIRVHAYIF